MSKVLQVSESGYYKWKSNKPRIRNKYQVLDKAIIKTFNTSNGSYGSPRIAIALDQSSMRVSKNTIARRMQVLNLTARPKKNYVITTDSKHSFKVPGNLLNRNFNIAQYFIWLV